MAGNSLEERMDSLERRVDVLEQLPAQLAALGSQILQLREEMRAEFSATRADARGGDEETRRYMRVLYEDLVTRIAALRNG